MTSTPSKMSVSAILVAGGIGTRMKASIPKQYLSLKGKPIALYGFELLCSLPEVKEIIVVCDPSYQKLFQKAFDALPKKPAHLAFAAPGERRQDSVYNGLQATNPLIPFVSIHDAARPLVTKQTIQHALQAAYEHGASAVGMPLKFTIKECSSDALVVQTPDRTRFWEIQTPQTMRRQYLEEGFKKAQTERLTVTDDVALVEMLGHPVKLVEGSYTNIKITTHEDLLLAELLISTSKALA